MILIDTSIWVDHLRAGNRRLQTFLENAEVLVHPFVVGEIACGTMRHREDVLTLLRALPTAQVAEHDEVMELVERARLHGRGSAGSTCICWRQHFCPVLHCGRSTLGLLKSPLA